MAQQPSSLIYPGLYGGMRQAQGNVGPPQAAYGELDRTLRFPDPVPVG